MVKHIYPCKSAAWHPSGTVGMPAGLGNNLATGMVLRAPRLWVLMRCGVVVETRGCRRSGFGWKGGAVWKRKVDLALLVHL